MSIVSAQPRDLGQIWLLRQERADWLSSLGSDQWSGTGLDREAFLDRVRRSIEARQTWVYLHNGAIQGTIAVDHWADSGLWTPEQLGESVIVHRMITARTAAGQEIGAALLDWAEMIAAHEHRSWIRLDAWTTNHGLHRYYESQGFRYVRTASEHGTPSGALFERPVRASEIPAAIGLATGDGDTKTVHRLPGLQVEYCHLGGASTPAVVAPGHTYALCWKAGRWMWNNDYPADGALTDSLDRAITYRVASYPMPDRPAVMLAPIDTPVRRQVEHQARR